MPSTLTRSRSRSTSSWVGCDADVGGEQGVLDLLPGVLVEVVAGQQREQPLAERVLRAGEPGAQPDQAAGGGLGDLDRGRRRSLDDRRLLDGDGRRRPSGRSDLLDGAARFVARRLGLVADMRLGGGR